MASIKYHFHTPTIKDRYFAVVVFFEKKLESPHINILKVSESLGIVIEKAVLSGPTVMKERDKIQDYFTKEGRVKFFHQNDEKTEALCIPGEFEQHIMPILNKVYDLIAFHNV